MPPDPARFRPVAAWTELDDGFHDPVAPARFPRHAVRWRDARAAARIGLDGLDDAEWVDRFARFEPIPGSLPQPLALRYHGHQFRVYNPDIGDGRGFLYAQALDPEDGRLLDFGTKGSGRTPWSRSGDGRLTLKGGVREVLAAGLLEARGVETSKAFSLIETGEALERGDEPSPTRSSVLTRLSHSHVRIGTFQRLAFHDDAGRIAALVAYVCRHLLPEAARPDPTEQAAAMLDAAVARVAAMGAGWMAAGFVHGVINTDNVVVTGESFDYGPWRFLTVYDPGFTAAYFDHAGLYCYARQPTALHWALARLAECLLPLAVENDLVDALDRFPGRFQAALALAVNRRLGLAATDDPIEADLVRAWFSFLHESQAPFEGAFHDWRGGPAAAARALAGPRASHYAHPAFAAVQAAFDRRKPAANARLDHPLFAAPEPVDLPIGRVNDAIWEPIAARDDWGPFQAAMAEIARARDALQG